MHEWMISDLKWFGHMQIDSIIHNLYADEFDFEMDFRLYFFFFFLFIVLYDFACKSCGFHVITIVVWYSKNSWTGALSLFNHLLSKIQLNNQSWSMKNPFSGLFAQLADINPMIVYLSILKFANIRWILLEFKRNFLFLNRFNLMG